MGGEKSLWPVLAAVSAGGVLGALARYGLATAWPHRSDEFAWATLITNVSGCLLIGVLMVLVTEVYPNQRLLRPFLGVGVLGGFTTFSTYVVDVGHAATAGAVGTAFAYFLATVVGALVAVWIGVTATSRVVALRRTARP
ncbi:fluoride efflux transporter FluC [Cryptosporangium aurantiacum]|uniref:fluoride efflux transporter FluC n=1 Tax=Cryptosporangium aurantiacum TaxID=134849 RepID=UPI001C49FADB|nr:CrcB family protein [Cryptosporangium aurantiacum]